MKVTIEILEDSAKVKVVILCGGKGTRLREETEEKPKPMVEIGGRPILWHIMKSFAYYGFHEFVLCLGYRGDVIRHYFLHYRAMKSDFTVHLGSGTIVPHSQHQEDDWSVSMVDTGPETRKGRRVKLVEPYLGGERFFLTYGDGLCDLDIRALIAFHESHGRTVTFTGVRPRSRWATAELDTHGRVVGWKEKQRLHAYINGGFFVMEPRVLSYLGEDQELEEEPMETLTAEGEVAVYAHDGFWECMDTYRDYTYLNELWSKGQAPWAPWLKDPVLEVTNV